MTTDPHRNRQLAAIHAGAKQVGIGDDDYRALVSRYSGGRTDSAGKLTPDERGALLTHLQSLGAGTSRPVAGKGKDSRPQAAYLRALWQSLWQLGEVDLRDDDALAAWVQRTTKIEVLRWTDANDLRIAGQALKGWCKRVGYVPSKYTGDGACAGTYWPALIEAQWARLKTLGEFAKSNGNARLDFWLSKQGMPVGYTGALTPKQAQQAVNLLGVWIRRVRAKAKAAGVPDA